MEPKIDAYLTEPDLVVLNNLFKDVSAGLRTEMKLSETVPPPETLDHISDFKQDCTTNDRAALDRLKALNDPSSPDFSPTVFVMWDEKDIPSVLNEYVVRPYARLATRIVRHPTDVVFLTHILIYLFVILPSAVRLFTNFNWIHGFVHSIFTFWCAGSYTLMLHNHIHNNGVLAKSWSWLDFTFPYITEPLMGHTWDSYYYHHVKHHHVEGNGPDDLSSTIRYQRDDIFHFLHYVGRFLFFVWIDLPLYFVRKGKPALAAKAFFSEMASYTFMYFMTQLNPRASSFVFLVPFTLLRLGLMVGNWGQHALVDEIEPDSDFRSSITLVDVPVSHSNLIPPPIAYLQPPQHSSNTQPITEQPLLLQRWLSHSPPPQPPPALARTTRSLPPIQRSIPPRSRIGILQHRLSLPDSQTSAKGLPASCVVFGTHG